jgi:hypothetical protein
MIRNLCDDNPIHPTEGEVEQVGAVLVERLFPVGFHLKMSHNNMDESIRLFRQQGLNIVVDGFCQLPIG